MKKINKILVPVDGSKAAIKGLSLALNIAKATGAEIFAIHVICYSNGYGFPVSSEMKKNHRDEAEKIILDAKNRAKKENVKFEGKISHGQNIGKEIIKFANSKKVSHIVIGSKGPDPGAEIFLGSVANYVLHKTKIPITIVR